MSDKIATIHAYKRFVQGEDGKLILSDLERFCHFKSSTYTGDAQRMIYNEGMRNVFLYINSLINVDPKALEMMAEGQSED